MRSLKNYSRSVVISGTLLIWIIKFLVRPWHLYSEGLTDLVGVAPNLIGSFLLPFGAYWLFRKYFLLRDANNLKVTCWFGLLLVIINEYLQLIPLFGRTFDTLDIVASFAGVYTGYIAFDRMMATRVTEFQRKKFVKFA